MATQQTSDTKHGSGRKKEGDSKGDKIRKGQCPLDLQSTDRARSFPEIVEHERNDCGINQDTFDKWASYENPMPYV